MSEPWALAVRAYVYALFLERQMRPPPAYFAFTMMFNWYATHRVSM